MLGQNLFVEPNQHPLTYLHPKYALQCTMEFHLGEQKFIPHRKNMLGLE
jgi:hypothetical protein